MKKIRIQAVVEDTGGKNTGKYNHNDKDNNNIIRNKMKSRTHGSILVKTEKDGRKLWGPNKAKYDLKDVVLTKELRWILHAEEDKRFVKGWFCFQYIEPT